MVLISVILPTYNPNIERLIQTLNGLRNQTIAVETWELLIIDNNSSISFCDEIDISWQPNSKIIKEPKQGLTFARLAGFKNSSSDIIVMVDDDNIISDEYLAQVYDIFLNNKELGAIGGISAPIYEEYPPKWISHFENCLAIRNLGNKEITGRWEGEYPNFAPIGAGMSIRKMALSSYLKKNSKSEVLITDRIGTSLSSGGDNDIIIHILKEGWQIGYFPSLKLAHIIPKNRTNKEYLSRLNHDSSQSWVKLLAQHQINPWHPISKFSLPFRYLKAYINHRAWASEQNYIKWKGSCGIFKGLSEINR